jgi:formylmethanofuran dehydrogenase subunit E
LSLILEIGSEKIMKKFKKIIIALAVSATLLGELLMSFAMAHENVKTLRGALVKIDAKNNFLAIRTLTGQKMEEVTLQILPDTAVQIGEDFKLGFEKDAFSTFKAGDKIGLTYFTDATEQKVAHSVWKLPIVQDKPKEKKEQKEGAGVQRKEINFLTFNLPAEADIYSKMIQPLVKMGIVEKYGEEEWRLMILTHEFHEHVGVYSLLATKMGIHARELLQAPVSAMVVISEAGFKAPLACMTDGLSVGSGATLGRGNLFLANPNSGEDKAGNPAAQFYYQNKKLRLILKREIVDAVEAKIKKASAEFGFRSPRYFQEVDKMAIWSWAEHDRKKIFEMEWLN